MNVRQLSALLEQKQRLLGESADALRRCENTIRECRAELDAGRDRSHVRWLVPSALLLIAGYLLAGVILPLALICLAVGAVLAVRWLSGFVHCIKKYSRASKRLQSCLNEQDRLSDVCSALRLETAELRQKIDDAERK